MTITKEKLAMVRDRMNAVLGELGTELGIELRTGRISYTENAATIKVEMSTIDETGETITKEAEDFRRYKHRHGLPDETLYKEFKHQGSRYMLIGYLPRSTKYPFLCKNLTTGSRSKFPPNLLERCLEA